MDFLLRLMRDPRAPIARRLEAAKAVAPFLHPRLCSVERPPSIDPEKSERRRLEIVFVRPPLDTLEN